MRSAILGIVFAAICQAALAQTFPQRFQGVWKYEAGQPGTCKQSDWNSDAHTDQHIKITPDTIDLHETRCIITSVRKPDKDRENIGVRLTLSCAGEGRNWTSQEIWQVQGSDGGVPALMMASIHPGFELISLYRRCDGAVGMEAAATLPLKPGFYVTSDTPCSQASNATLSLVRRNGMGAARMSCDFTKIEMLDTKRYRVTEKCEENGQAIDEPVVNTYEIADNSSFKHVLQDGEYYYARYCEQKNLPEPWRNNDISDLIR